MPGPEFWQLQLLRQKEYEAAASARMGPRLCDFRFQKIPEAAVFRFQKIPEAAVNPDATVFTSGSVNTSATRNTLGARPKLQTGRPLFKGPKKKGVSFG